MCDDRIGNDCRAERLRSGVGGSHPLGRAGTRSGDRAGCEHPGGADDGLYEPRIAPEVVRDGETIFWSRSRQELWHKGATSGNTQRIVELAADCDGDTLLIQVIPNGPACHTGTYTCFDADRSETAQVSEPPETLETLRAGADAVDRGADDPYPVLAELEQVIADREEERPEGAYTTYLFDSGIDKILKKIGEESAEVLIAAKNGDNEELTGEAADLLFHLLVLLRERKLPFAQVLNELQRRHQGPRRDAYNAHGKIKPSTES